MTMRALEGRQFVRKTQLAPGEYRKNFHQIDRDILAAVTSEEADAVTPLMSKIYLRLVNAPERFWEREGVLRIEAEVREERLVKAWTVLCGLVGVSSATASKALRWMHEQGIVGYFSGKNGVGLRIFLNRAASSIGVRQHRGGEKILSFPPASSGAAAASADEPAFNDPFGVLEGSDTDKKFRAPKNGAEKVRVVNSSPTHPAPSLSPSPRPFAATQSTGGDPTPAAFTRTPPIEEFLSRLNAELELRMTEIAVRTAARTARQEMEYTRQWFESKALPKAIRVAQRETYELARKLERAGVETMRVRAGIEVGRQREPAVAPAAKPLLDGEVREAAETCVALLDVQGKPVEATLSEICADGGWLLAEDAPRVRAEVEELLRARCEGGKSR